MMSTKEAWELVKDVFSSLFIAIGILIVGVLGSLVFCVPLVAAWYGVSWLIHQAILAVGWPSSLTAVQGIMAGVAGLGMLTYSVYKQGKEIDAWVEARMAEAKAEAERYAEQEQESE